MHPPRPELTVAVPQLVRVKPEPAGQFTAQAVGLPEIRATAVTKEQAVEQVRALLTELLTSEELVPIELPRVDLARKWNEWAQSDPEYNVYLEEMRRFRQELDEQFQQDETEPPCSASSSTPTT
jgi:hypothetical protein